MNTHEKTSRVLGYLFTALTGLAALTAVIAVLRDFEVQSNYFRLGAILPKVALALTIAAIAVGAVRSFLPKKEHLGAHPFATTAALSPAFYGFVIGALLLLFKEISATTILMSLCMALSAVYIWFTGNQRYKKDAGAVVFCGFSTILTFVLFCALFYFDASVEINAPLKIANTVALLCCMIYFTGELRFLLERPQKKLFLLMAHTAAAIAIPVALAVFTAFFTEVAYTVANVQELSLVTVLRALKIESVSAAVVVLGTGLHALSGQSRLLTPTATDAEPQGVSEANTATPSEEYPAEDDAEDASAPKQAEKQPLPWEVDIDTLNRKE